MFIQLKPQTPSQLGKYTKYDKIFNPWRVTDLHIFDLWSEDDILKNSTCNFVTERLRNGISEIKLSGIEIGPEVKTEVSDTFKNLFPEKILPTYFLIHIEGKPQIDDFGIESPNKLILSDGAISFLRRYNITHAEANQI